MQSVDAVPVQNSLRIDLFERVTSFLFATMVLLSTAVWLMFLLWLISSDPVLSPPGKIERYVERSGSMGLENQFEVPDESEVSELREPSLADALHALSDVASTRAVSLHRRVGSTGMGDGDAARTAGPLNGSPDGSGDGPIGRAQRWEIVFNTTGKQDYAKQLDHFAIELAAFGGGSNVIESATQLSTTPRRHVNNRPASETRLYFSWKLDNPLARYDRQLLHDAGIATAGRNLIRFTPPALERELTRLEAEVCQRNGKTFPDEIAKTVFESKRLGDGYVFVVVAQRYR